MAIRVWNGSGWTDVTQPYVWNGVYWDTILAGRVWDGAAWVDFFPGVYAHTVVESTTGTFVGYSSASYFPGVISGSSMTPQLTIGSRNIGAWFYFNIKGTTGVRLNLDGDQTGTWWSYGTYRGTTFYRANCINPTGNYDSGSNYTQFAISNSEMPTFSGSGTYTLMLYP
jgi:hypothetical protein